MGNDCKCTVCTAALMDAPILDIAHYSDSSRIMSFGEINL